MAEKARQLNCYIVCPFILKKDDGRLYNTAAVLDRQGRWIGSYDKIHVVTNCGKPGVAKQEMDNHVEPGLKKPTVIPTDFGKIDIEICFDAYWHQRWTELKQAGAEIVFFPSAYSAGRKLDAIALLNELPIVAAANFHSRIIDRDGFIAAEEKVYGRYVAATIDLDSPMFNVSEQHQKIAKIRKEYGQAVQIRMFDEEGLWRILPQREDITVPDIIRKFSLVTNKEYIDACEHAQDERRNQIGDSQRAH